MTYVVDRPNIQLDAADCLAIKNAFGSNAVGFPASGPNINLDAHDLAVLHASVVGSQIAVNTENVNLTAADVVALVSHVT